MHSRVGKPEQQATIQEHFRQSVQNLAEPSSDCPTATPQQLAGLIMGVVLVVQLFEAPLHIPYEDHRSFKGCNTVQCCHGSEEFPAQ